MPWIAVGVFLSGLRLHYIDHAFHLAKRTDMALFSIALPALLNLVLNLVLLPCIGVLGAVISTVAAYALAIAVDVVLTARVFAMPLPPRPAAKVTAATAVMVIVVKLADFPLTTFGLIAVLATGAAVYAVTAFALDIAGIRTMFTRRARQPNRPPSVPAT